jgi:hypothetical protein
MEASHSSELSVCDNGSLLPPLPPTEQGR